MRGHNYEFVVALALGLGLTTIFRLFPEIDLGVSGYFYDGAGFPLSESATLQGVREAGLLVPWIVLTTLVAAIVLKLVRPFRRMLIPPRAVLFLFASLAIGPGLIANVILKDHWDRARPREIVDFGGETTFSKAWTISDQCPDNCSFVSGEASVSFWTVAVAALAPASIRVAAFAAAYTFGLAIGMLRVAFGGHFLSDVLMAGIITYLVAWICWRIVHHSRFPQDSRLETALERFGRRLALVVVRRRRRLVAIGRRTRRLIARRGGGPIVAR